MNTFRKFVWLFTFIFIVISIFLIRAESSFIQWNIDSNRLIQGNALLFILTLGTFLMQRKALQNSNPNVFVRSVMGGMMIKMLAIAIIIVVYAKMGGEHFSKTTVLVFLLLYIIYLAAEVSAVVKLNKKTHA